MNKRVIKKKRRKKAKQRLPQQTEQFNKMAINFFCLTE